MGISLLRWWVLAIFGFFAVVVGAVSALPIHPAAAAIGHSVGTVSSDDVELSAVANVVLSISSTLEREFEKSYGGMFEISKDVSVIRVVDLESASAQELISFVRAVQADSFERVGRTIEYRFEQYPVTFQQIKLARNLVVDLMKSEEARARFGIVSVGIGFDGVEVGVERYEEVESLQSLLDQQFPDVRIEIRAATASETTADRYSDSQPWNGGDMLAISLGGSATYACSSGPGAHDSQGNRFLLMAAHCGMNFFYNTNFGNPQLNNPVGPMTSRIYSNYYPEVGIISTNSSQYFWEGAGPGVRRITMAAVDPVVGMQVCGQGVTTAAYWGTNCGNVALVDTCEWFKNLGLTFCGLFRWDGSASLPGDSGGYISYSSIYGFGAVGTITGSNSFYSQSFGTAVAYHKFFWGLTLNTPSTP